MLVHQCNAIKVNLFVQLELTTGDVQGGSISSSEMAAHPKQPNASSTLGVQIFGQSLGSFKEIIKQIIDAEVTLKFISKLKIVLNFHCCLQDICGWYYSNYMGHQEHNKPNQFLSYFFVA